MQRFWGDVTEELPGEDGWVDGRKDRQTNIQIDWKTRV